MPVKIKFDKDTMTYKITNMFNSKLGLLASEILNDCNQYCKEDTGMLIASSYIHSRLDEGKLIWQTPYARRQYWGIPTAYQTVNPNAVWKWCEYAQKAHVQQWIRQAQMLIEGKV